MHHFWPQPTASEVDEDDQDDEGADDDEEEEQDEGFSIDDDEVINAPNLLPLRLVGFADTESLSLESTQLAELIQDEEELAEIDTSNIVWTGRRRNAPLDYSSEEALKQAGLDKSSAAVEQEEDDAECQVSAIPCISTPDGCIPQRWLPPVIATDMLHSPSQSAALTTLLSSLIHRAKAWTTNDRMVVTWLAVLC